MERPRLAGDGITVVVPVYYGRQFLPTALESVRRQTTSLPVHLIVVEDGTPLGQRSRDIAESFSAEYHLLSPNRGVAQARKIGADRSPFASGFLAFLDQDDRWYPNFLDRMTQALAASSAGFVVCNMDMQEDTGRTYRLYQTKRPSLRLADLKMFNHIVSPSQVLMRLKAFRSVSWPPPLSHPGADDWALWLTLLSHGYAGLYLSDPLVAYLDHAGGAHRDFARLNASADSVVKDVFSLLHFSGWDARKYWALATVNRALAMRHADRAKAALALALALGKDFPAATAALWYRLQRRVKHLV
ncbi:MAG: glycosyltransferase family A protein [Thermaerobacter sp.]|nr:glycosyltransferase family A protein [Thermaerobacter sp.]